MKNEMISYAHELQILLLSNDLRKISQWSFEQREAGRNVPYMSILNMDKNKVVTDIIAKPTATQKSLKAFFDETREGSLILPRYTLRVSLEKGVEFFEVKVSKGEKINLL